MRKNRSLLKNFKITKKMKKSIRLFTTVMVCMAMALCVSCKKDNAEPSGGNTGGGGTQTVATVTTEEVTEITQTTAICGGEVTSDGGAAVTACGVCWSTSQNPTVSDSHTTDGSGTGSFTSNITGLTDNTTYYVRAYATNSEGTSYGEQRSFTTSQNITSPTVTTNNVTDITQTTATCGGEVTSDGGATVTARGVCWGTEPNPTPSDNCTVDGEGVGAFTSEMTGLEPGTKYYVRAYAKNAAGTGFGAERSFTTLENGGGGDGRFSVSSGTTVEFAPGNLYWDGSAFRFEANQWSLADTWNASHVSHFFWSNTTDWQESGKEPYAASYLYSTQTTDDVFFTEASGFQVSGETAGTWRTLSSAEWDYLLYTRDNASSLRAWVTLSDVSVSGLVILPDGSSATASGITTSSALAGSGAVFLPAAGDRGGMGVHSVGSLGYYWSSSLYTDNPSLAYCMRFDSGDVYSFNDYRYSGYPVRLVR